MPPADGRTNPAALATVLIDGLLLAAIYAASTTLDETSIGVEEFVYPSSLLVSLVGVWTLWSWSRVAGSLFNPFGLFLIAAFLFNGGQAILEVFRLNEGGMLHNRFDAFVLTRTLLLSSIGLLAFHLGGCLYAVLWRPDRSETRVGHGVTRRDLAAFRVVGWALFAIAVVPAMSQAVQAVRIVVASGYFSLYQQQDEYGVQAAPAIVAQLIVPSSIFILIGGRSRKREVAASAVIIGSYALYRFFLGYRAHAVMPLVAYLWTYHRVVMPLRRSALLLSGAAMFFGLFPLIAAARQLTGSQRLTPSVLIDAYVSIDNPAVAILREVGNSMQTTAWTLTLVPDVRAHEWGTGYLKAALGVVPNVFGGVHPAIASGSASGWLVQTVSPQTAEAGGGFGYSFIAEAFLQFGWAGSAFALVVIGFAFSRIMLPAVRSADPRVIGLAACFLAVLSQYARGEMTSVIRPFVWYGLFPMLLVVLISPRTARERDLVVRLGPQRHAPVTSGAPASPDSALPASTAGGSR